MWNNIYYYLLCNLCIPIYICAIGRSIIRFQIVSYFICIIKINEISSGMLSCILISPYFLDWILFYIKQYIIGFVINQTIYLIFCRLHQHITYYPYYFSKIHFKIRIHVIRYCCKKLHLGGLISESSENKNYGYISAGIISGLVFVFWLQKTIKYIIITIKNKQKSSTKVKSSEINQYSKKD